MAAQDFRARLQPKGYAAGASKGVNKQAHDVLGVRSPNNLLFPLYATNGVIFPYTPSITTGYVADYDPSAFIHTNYGYNAYIRSYTKPISIAAEFTAQTNDEALYLLAVLHFFRSVTKCYFGVDPYKKAGTPPPVLVFNYMGDYQYNNVPVLVKSFDFTYDASIDYVPVYTGAIDGYSSGVSLPKGTSNGYTMIPTHLTVNVELDTQYTPIGLRDKFNLDKFRSGHLVNGGFI